MTSASGKIITFYSYKGGTGRSMALANAAWILAANGNRVLTIDWDLEAPGLHRYFRPFLIDSELSSTPGLINFFWDYAAKVMTPMESDIDEDDWWENVTQLSRYTIRLDWEFESNGSLDLIGAGQQDSQYAELFNSFNWNNFYRRLDGELLLARLRELMKNEYDYVLIDSRTGVSDTSGISTVSMPDQLVALFTLNRQSVDGVAAVLDSIKPQRINRPLQIFPVVTRVELGEKERLDAARSRVRRVFAPYVENNSRGSNSYWNDMEINYQPYYAYEEILAPFGDPTGSNRSPTALLASMERMIGRVTDQPGIAMPMVTDERRQDILGQFAGTERDEQAATIGVDQEEQRRGRAEKYLERDLDDPVRWFRMKSLRLRFHSQLAFGVVVAAQLLIPLLMVIKPTAWTGVTPNMTLAAFALCGIIVLLKVLEAILSRHRFLVSLGTLVALLAEGGVQFWAAWTYFGEAVALSLDLYLNSGIALLAIAAQTSVIISRSAELARHYASVADQLNAELRRYVHGLDPYSGSDENQRSGWSQFIERLEQLMATPAKEVSTNGDSDDTQSQKTATG